MLECQFESWLALTFLCFYYVAVLKLVDWGLLWVLRFPTPPSLVIVSANEIRLKINVTSTPSNIVSELFPSNHVVHGMVKVINT